MGGNVNSLGFQVPIHAQFGCIQVILRTFAYIQSKLDCSLNEESALLGSITWNER